MNDVRMDAAFNNKAVDAYNVRGLFAFGKIIPRRIYPRTDNMKMVGPGRAQAGEYHGVFNVVGFGRLPKGGQYIIAGIQPDKNQIFYGESVN
jgi:hypothetical protein